MMERTKFINVIEQAFRVHPIVALLGPRQCGKTTLARAYSAMRSKQLDVTYYDCEDPADAVQLENPMLALKSLKGLVIIDEIQLMPEIFACLRVLVDKEDSEQQFLILGSASSELVQKASDTLAGRITNLELTPFSYTEVDHLQTLWLRGGFPLSYLAKDIHSSVHWRKEYIKTFLEKDIPRLGINIPPQALRRFWMMLAHFHGNIFNASQIGRSLGASDTTVKRYLDILTGTYMVRQLYPWVENIKKRQVKSPKIYFRDSGIFHTLCDINNNEQLHHHPSRGQSWEGVALEEIIRYHHAEPENCYFWAIHSQAELDLLIFHGGKKLGFEFKHQDAPNLTRSMKTAMDILGLDELSVIYPGDKEYSLTEKIKVIGLENYLSQA